MPAWSLSPPSTPLHHIIKMSSARKMLQKQQLGGSGALLPGWVSAGSRHSTLLWLCHLAAGSPVPATCYLSNKNIWIYFF